MPGFRAKRGVHAPTFLGSTSGKLRSGVVAGAVLALVEALPGHGCRGAPVTKLAASHTFTQPLYLTNAGDSRLFVVQKGGRIKIIHANESVTTFLDISAKVSTSSERGLLGLAFHPSYSSNSLFYVKHARRR